MEAALCLPVIVSFRIANYFRGLEDNLSPLLAIIGPSTPKRNPLSPSPVSMYVSFFGFDCEG